MKTPDNMANAYTQRAEGRWWIFHWTPAGMIVRLLVSYPDKGAALGAIGTLGYRLVDQPRPADEGGGSGGRAPGLGDDRGRDTNPGPGSGTRRPYATAQSTPRATPGVSGTRAKLQ